MNQEMSNEQRDLGMLLMSNRMMAFEVLIRALIKTHPDHGELTEAVRYFETGLGRTLPGPVPRQATELIQSFLDQAGAG